MRSVLIRDLTEETHRKLMRQARRRGQSLQQYLAGELRRLASSPTLDEVLARVEARSGGRVGLEQAVEDVTAERERR